MLNLYDGTFIVALLFIVGVLFGNIVHGIILIAITIIASMILSVVLWRRYHNKIVFLLVCSLFIGALYTDDISNKQQDKKVSDNIAAYLSPMKIAFENSIKRALPSDTAALALGLLLGDKSGFTKEMKEEFKRSGTTHIVALSGFNIMLIAGFIGGLLYWTPPLANLIATIILITLFVIMTGAESSSVRAAIMGGLLVIANYSGRIYQMRNVITATAAVMLIQDPALIVKSVGFQLSFFALLGIVYIEPILKKWAATENKFINTGLTTIAAQIGVLPILINTFGSFSWSSIVANILVGITIPYAMFAAFITGLSGLLFGSTIAAVVGLGAHYILAYELFIIHFTSKFGFIEGLTTWNIPILITYYVLLFTIVVIYQHEQQEELQHMLYRSYEEKR